MVGFETSLSTEQSQCSGGSSEQADSAGGGSYRQSASWTVALEAKSDAEWDVVKYKVVLADTDEGFSVSCPGLPGCWSQGKTEAEALENIKSAIQEYLAAVNEISKGQATREVEVTL